MVAKNLVQPLKWHGGKSYLASKIVALMPPRCKKPNKPAPDDLGWLHYVEPYFGGGSVMLTNDPEGISEVVNDLNSNLTMFWRVLQSPNDFINFRHRVESTPFSSDEFERASRHLKNEMGSDTAYWDKAAAFFIVCRQSHSGRLKEFAAITRNRIRKGMNEQVSAWLNCIEGLPEVHARLKRVLILNEPALNVIRKQDGPRTLFYLDPPYLHETRATTGEYQHEMTDDDHAALLAALAEIKGRFLLSGYHSELYDECAAYHGWRCHEFDINNNAAGGKTKRRMTECVWCNF
jgi:DNA adenine methylase